ncbi:MAG: hypothetical protein U1C71_00925, partial [archaeon]|nr:hypothetical protein [archaeon]
MDLSLHRVLSALELDRDVHIHHLVESTGMSADAIRRVLGELESQGLARVTREKVIHWILSPTGLAALEKNSLPEQRLGTILDPKPLSLDDLRNTFDGTTQEFTAAFGLAKRSQWIEVKGDGEQTMVALTHLGKKSIANSPVWMMLQALARDEFPPRDSPIVAELQARGLILPKTTTNELARLTPDGKKALAQKRISSSKQIGPLTPSILMSGDWKKGSFKPYDVKAGVDEKQVGRIHPLRSVIYDVQKIMVELGFQEQESPLVESAFWNMDVMFIPQDHPAREIQ